MCWGVRRKHASNLCKQGCWVLSERRIKDGKGFHGKIWFFTTRESLKREAIDFLIFTWSVDIEKNVCQYLSNKFVCRFRREMLNSIKRGWRLSSAGDIWNSSISIYEKERIFVWSVDVALLRTFMFWPDKNSEKKFHFVFWIINKLPYEACHHRRKASTNKQHSKHSTESTKKIEIFLTCCWCWYDPFYEI